MKINIFGVTGSIGKNVVKIIASQPEKYAVKAITANNNVKLLAEMAIKLQAEIAVINNSNKYEELKKYLENTNITAYAGRAALMDVASLEVDITIGAIVGIAGLEPLFKSIKCSKIIGLANKEALVCAGKIFMDAVNRHKCQVIPIDSEHNAILQIFEERNKDKIDQLVLTASGGAFLNMPMSEMQNITPKMAVSHPNWDMGAKISVDSSTMFNKLLEIIEAYYLFDISYNKISAIIHPESIIHSMVYYSDGAVLAQMGVADMTIPISYMLNYPSRIKTYVEKLDLLKINSLNFHAIDLEKFSLFTLKNSVIEAGQYAQIAINAANEVAVENFLQGKIKFT
ncbi:MAG: 1-deoxy-D-xylulose-5-phosphate reductoisomerase, partial [Pseudomonadota bacterium]